MGAVLGAVREVLGATVGSLGAVLGAVREVLGATVGSLGCCFGCCKKTKDGNLMVVMRGVGELGDYD